MMIVRNRPLAIIPNGWLHASHVIVCCLLLCGVLAAQDLPNDTSKSSFQIPVRPSVAVQTRLYQFSGVKVIDPAPSETTRAVNMTVVHDGSNIAPDGTRHITLEEAKQQAAAADNPMAELAQQQLEAARQHRLGTESDYFPKLSATFTNIHFNKFMGEEFNVQRPILGTTTTLALPLVGKNQTVVAVSAAQPLTPLFKLREVVNIARADENVARAKAGLPVTDIASTVEKNFYELLVAQRQLVVAKANEGKTRDKQLLASNVAMPESLPSSEDEQIDTGSTLVIAASKVEELTASLNLLLGYPADTKLELVPPVLQFEEVSLKEASDKAMAANIEVVEAEQNVVKARAASKLSKLDYVPDFALLGGYVYQDNALPPLPRDFSYIAVAGSYNLFDFGKREHAVKERNAQLAMAETALRMTKAKVAASVNTAYIELDRSRQLSKLAHRLAAAVQLQRTSYEANPEVEISRAKIEVEMFQADLDYRQTLARLKTLMSER